MGMGARTRPEQEVLSLMEACLGCRCGPQTPAAAASLASSMSRYMSTSSKDVPVSLDGASTVYDCVPWSHTSNRHDYPMYSQGAPLTWYRLHAVGSCASCLVFDRFAH